MNGQLRKFFGRRRVIDEIVQGVLNEQPASFSLVGPKLVGKSMVLNYLASDTGPLLGDDPYTPRPLAFEDPGRVIVVKVDCNWPEAKDDLIGFLDLTARQEARRDGMPLEWDLIEQQSSGSRRLAMLTRQMARSGYRLVLLMDNFDKVFGIVAMETMNELRPLTQEVAMVVATEQPLHDIDPGQAASPLFNVMNPVFLGLLEPEAARQWLDEYTQYYPSLLPVTEDLLDLTGTHPYLLRRLGDILVEVQQMLPPQHAIGADHLPLIRMRLAEHGRLLFETLWRRLLNPPKRVVRTVVLDLLQRMLLSPLAMPGASSAEAGALNWLINQAMVTFSARDGGMGYKLFSPLFVEYLRSRDLSSVLPTQVAEPSATPPPVLANAPFYDRLTKTEIALLHYFQTHSQQVVTPEQLLQDVWKRSDATPRRVQEAIRRLRFQLQEATPAIGAIKNERGRGYRFVPA